MSNSFATRSTLDSGGTQLEYHSLPALAERFPAIDTLPWSLRILLENLLRLEDGVAVTASDIELLAT